MKIVITGAGGMLGQAVLRHCNDRGEQVVAMDRAALDITIPSQIEDALKRERPAVVINCAALTDVDACELDPKRAQLNNALGPEFLAAACRACDASLITISTDYVFDGEQSGFYTQRHQPRPISHYGKAKLDGERRAMTAWARTAVVRTGYVFGLGGKNFLSTCIRRLRRGEQLRVINDMYGTPSYAADVARRLHEIALLDLPGVYHVTNDGEGSSFYDFAQAAASEMGLSSDHLSPVSLKSLQLPAPRPANSRLKCILSPAVGLKPLRDWRSALKEFALEDQNALPGTTS